MLGRQCTHCRRTFRRCCKRITPILSLIITVDATRRDASLSIVRIADHALMLVALATACLAEETNAALLRSRGFISADAAGTRLICEIVKMMHVRERRQAFDVALMRPWFDRAYGRLARAGIDLADQGTAWLDFTRLVECFKPKIIGLARQLGYRECEFTSE
ncbi:MAG: hypothetical protein M3R64_07620 [Pseudomonadota bacterium]|nr:hypothetical protein [Pseudomonadota bacterium]